jgi:glycosyltransferase involved in cell wall biosynthesis
MKIAIVTDAWFPQVNGVVTTLDSTGRQLRAWGHDVTHIGPDHFRTVPCPTYPAIRLAVGPGRKLARLLDRYQPDAIHLATEGPLGLAGRHYCRTRQLRFTTSYHTKFPHYVRMRAPIPMSWTYRLLRWFHSAAERTLVPTDSVREDLRAHGFKNLAVWARGVDTEMFKPSNHRLFGRDKPVALYAGRVAVEKNLEGFLDADLDVLKVVVGDGPDRDELKRRYPLVRFTGFKFGDDLARHMASADVFVFPSRTDSFGIVMLEAMACCLPVAAYPVPGPVDVVHDGVTGILNDDIATAITRALELDRQQCRTHALECSWEACTGQFLSCLAPNRAPN